MSATISEDGLHVLGFWVPWCGTPNRCAFEGDMCGARMGVGPTGFTLMAPETDTDDSETILACKSYAGVSDMLANIEADMIAGMNASEERERRAIADCEARIAMVRAIRDARE